MPADVRLGDCLDVMRVMPADSVHAIVTDPPYNLAFMSREWDTHATPRDFQNWCQRWAEECLRVLRPGGYLLAFGGTRTFHRLAVAVEDAGFEIRDSIAWLYGCLDDQTELLVDGRWAPYRNVKQSQHALGYDVERDEFSWQPIQRVVVFPYSDTAYRLVGDHTDQLVTREHRCLVERGGAYEFCEAQEVARQREARVPVLEDVQRLLDALPLPHSGAGGAEPDLLVDVRGASRQPSENGTPGCQCQPVADVPGVRCGVPAVAYEAARGPATGVLGALPREAGRGPAACRCTEGSRRLDGSITGVLHGEGVRPRQPGVEGRGDVLAVKGQLQGREVRAVPIGVRGDEPRGRVRHGAPPAGCACDGSTAAAHRGRAPRGPRPAEQRAGEPVAVRVEPRPQAARGARFTTADLVRVEREHYDGIAWCVTVPTGAFVARRNGKVFVTGNSGFPKSLDVGKAIDKAAGATREVTRAGEPVQYGGLGEDWTVGVHSSKRTRHDAPATDAARQWAGWGTALKPAFEPIVVARKPLTGTVAANIHAWGTGALNIDACRVASRPGDYAHGGNDNRVSEGWHGGGLYVNAGRQVEPHSAGRWPANVALDGDQADALDQQSGIRRSAGDYPSDASTEGMFGQRTQGNLYADSGGASRFFPTFRYQAKAPTAERPTYTTADGRKIAHPTVKPLGLMRWLVRLVTPPGGTVLDPFAGSGATVEACLIEGFDCIAIERDADYLPLIAQRIDRQAGTLPLDQPA